MKKIIISANVLWTITNFRKNLILFLQGKGYEIICVAGLDSLSIDYQQDIKNLGIRFIEVKINRKGINPIEDFRYFLELFFIYKQEKPCMIFHFTIKPNIYGSLAARLAGIGSINTINGLGSAIIANNILAKVIRYLYRFSLAKSKKVFVQNSEDAKFLQKYHIVKDVDIVAGSGVDVASFKTFLPAKDKVRFLFVGRLLKDKGLIEYLEASKAIRLEFTNVEFLVAGAFDDGNPSAISKEFLEKYSDVVKYLGVTQNIEEFFAQADVIVLPSYREGLSRVLIEAASSAKILIATDVAGCREVVQDGYNGFLVKKQDVVSLQSAMKKVIGLSYQDKMKLSQNSRKYAVNFDKSVVNAKYEKELQC